MYEIVRKGVKMKRILKASIYFVIIILLIFMIFISVDYYRYKEYKRPIFAFYPVTLLDGGTKEYWGLGYKIIYFNRLVDRYWGDDAQIKFIGPIWIDNDKAYKIATKETYGEVFGNLNSITEKGIYYVLSKNYSIKEAEEIFSYKYTDEIEYYFKLFEVYDNLNEEDQKILMYEIKDYYSIKKDTMTKQEKGKFDLFLYGFDYTTIDY